VDLPPNKRVEVALTYIYGIGKTSAKKILEKTRISPDTRVNRLTEEQVSNLRSTIESEYAIEGSYWQRQKSVTLIWTDSDSPLI